MLKEEPKDTFVFDTKYIDLFEYIEKEKNSKNFYLECLSALEINPEHFQQILIASYER